MSSLSTSNALLATMSASDRDELCAIAQSRHYRKGQMLVAGRAPVRSVLFVTSGTIAATVPIDEGETVEVFVIGSEGVTGGWSGQPLSDFRLMARSDVQGLAVDPASLQALAGRRRGVADALADYGARLARELAQNSACNLRHRAGPRLAKWLVRNDDRGGGGPITVTAHAVADALGVQERLVRSHLRSLEDEGLVETSRLWLRVLDRDAVQARACGCYDPSRSVCDRPAAGSLARQAGAAPVAYGCEAAA
ncbi:Crp/Fnr family transcriptional regulator [Brevundimonas sp. VNH65]|uniref:Crp/Fnr family transcriptional regulator n=1 Tax=Brevundimonas sp. VNH65 TaxID=3400917 RepID=UPI003C0F806F